MRSSSGRFFFAGAAAAILVSSTAHGQSTFEMLSVVERPRPLAGAVSWLVERYPVVITYEDLQYEFSGDIQDVTSQVRRDDPNSPNRVLVPRRGTLQASFPISDQDGQPLDIADVVQQIVLAKNGNPVGGRFEVRKSGDIFHIVPTEARNSSGEWVRQQSILDTLITLSTGELNGHELLDAILDEVSETSGIRVSLAAARFNNTLFRYKGAVEVYNEPARDVLIRAMHAIHPRFTWVLNSSPALRYRVLNLLVAAEPPPEERPLDLLIIPRPGDPTPAGPTFEPVGER